MVLEAVQTFIDCGKSIAAICHNTHILISAAERRGRMATCYKSIAAEIKRVGAHYKKY